MVVGRYGQILAAGGIPHSGPEFSRSAAITLTGSELDAEPHAHRHDSVMDNVQRGHLVIFLAHDEEELNVNKLTTV